jgi:UDP-N-acetyl-D-glucosamine/UDP-N-acetyl-D-galactosamine dehydrogenase
VGHFWRAHPWRFWRASKPTETDEEWGLRLAVLEELRDVDALILAVPHCAYRDLGAADLLGRVRPGGVVFDMKSMLDPREIPAGIRYLSL